MKLYLFNLLYFFLIYKTNIILLIIYFKFFKYILKKLIYNFYIILKFK
jgi:hypothetical protein